MSAGNTFNKQSHVNCAFRNDSKQLTDYNHDQWAFLSSQCCKSLTAQVVCIGKKRCVRFFCRPSFENCNLAKSNRTVLWPDPGLWNEGETWDPGSNGKLT